MASQEIFTQVCDHMETEEICGYSKTANRKEKET